MVVQEVASCSVCSMALWGWFGGLFELLGVIFWCVGGMLGLFGGLFGLFGGLVGSPGGNLGLFGGTFGNQWEPRVLEPRLEVPVVDIVAHFQVACKDLD